MLNKRTTHFFYFFAQTALPFFMISNETELTVLLTMQQGFEWVGSREALQPMSTLPFSLLHGNLIFNCL